MQQQARQQPPAFAIQCSTRLQRQRQRPCLGRLWAATHCKPCAHSVRQQLRGKKQVAKVRLALRQVQLRPRQCATPRPHTAGVRGSCVECHKARHIAGLLHQGAPWW